MATSLTNLLYHIVFSTKGRVPLVTEALKEPVYEYLGGILRGQRSVLVEIGGMPDHVHLLAKLRADLAVASAIRVLKSNSSGWINENRKVEGRFEWQAGYFAVSVSESRVPEVRRYIRTQAEHHARISFRDELVAAAPSGLLGEGGPVPWGSRPRLYAFAPSGLAAVATCRD